MEWGWVWRRQDAMRCDLVEGSGGWRLVVGVDGRNNKKVDTKLVDGVGAELIC